MLSKSSAAHSDSTVPILAIPNVPTQSVVLIRDQAKARTVSRGHLDLVFDTTTGLIYNCAFDQSLIQYDEQYESTQSCSPTFNAFNRRLAQNLGRRHQLHGKTVLEIGCGNAEFLRILVEECAVRGVGFDPAFHANRAGPLPEEIEIIPSLFTRESSTHGADLIVCKMTLEHIPNPGSFLKTVRQSIPDREDPVLFVQVPNVGHILDEGAFWDLYYEHCSYFSAGTLARIFRRSGFDVLDLWTDYENQYLMIEARPAAQSSRSEQAHDREESVSSLARRVTRFADEMAVNLAAWSRLFEGALSAQNRIAIWGGSSKTVGFVTALGVTDSSVLVVDINPNKHGTYLPGSGLPIVGPESLPDFKPDIIVIMNPIYREEIEKNLKRLGLSSDIWTLDDEPGTMQTFRRTPDRYL